jgi:hypothetical protein
MEWSGKAFLWMSCISWGLKDGGPVIRVMKWKKSESVKAKEAGDKEGEEAWYSLETKSGSL